MRAEIARGINLGIIALCGWVLWSGLTGRFNAESGEPAPSSVLQRIAGPGGAALGIDAAPRTLIMFTSSECHFCVNSLPFYRRLAPALKARGVRLVAVSRDEPERNRAFLGSGGVAVDSAVSLAEAGMELAGTPTLVLVRRDGSAIKTWEGRLDSKGESEVLRLAIAE